MIVFTMLSFLVPACPGYGKEYRMEMIEIKPDGEGFVS
jgi:hypothetical protein